MWCGSLAGRLQLPARNEPFRVSVLQPAKLPVAPQPVEIVEAKPKRWTAAQIRAMDSETYRENLKNPEFANAVETLFE